MQADVTLLKIVATNVTTMNDRTASTPTLKPFKGIQDEMKLENFIWDMEHYL